MSMIVRGSEAAYNVYQNLQNAAKAKAQASTAFQSSDTEQTNKSGGNGTYYGHLTQNYDCVKNGKVSISPTYLRACADDPAKAKELEENLAVYNDCYESGLKSAQRLGEVLAYDHTWSFDKDGNLTMYTSVTVKSEGGGKSMEEFLEELEEEAEQKEEQDRLAGKKDIETEIEKIFTENSESLDIEVNVEVDIQFAETGEMAPGVGTATVDVKA